MIIQKFDIAAMAPMFLVSLIVTMGVLFYLVKKGADFRGFINYSGNKEICDNEYSNLKLLKAKYPSLKKYIKNKEMKYKKKIMRYEYEDMINFLNDTK